MDILKKIEQYREAEERLQWEGTFAEYLELVKERPWVAQTAHSRIYNMIKDAGIEEVDGRRKYNFFSNQLFGLEDALERLVEEYFHPSAKRLDVRKRILLLMGPVSGEINISYDVETRIRNIFTNRSWSDFCNKRMPNA